MNYFLKTLKRFTRVLLMNSDNNNNRCSSIKNINWIYFDGQMNKYRNSRDNYFIILYFLWFLSYFCFKNTKHIQNFPQNHCSMNNVHTVFCASTQINLDWSSLIPLKTLHPNINYIIEYIIVHTCNTFSYCNHHYLLF